MWFSCVRVLCLLFLLCFVDVFVFRVPAALRLFLRAVAPLADGSFVCLTTQFLSERACLDGWWSRCAPAAA